MRKSRTGLWMGAAFSVALILALLIVVFTPPGHRLDRALRATARWSYLWFWPAYVGGALATLFGARFLPLARHARDLGLAFASAHQVHIGIVAWLILVRSARFAPHTLVLFGGGVFWVYVLVLLSVERVVAALPPRSVRIARTIGVEYIALAFLVDFAKDPFHGGIRQIIAYLPYLALAVSGPLLRLAAAVKRSAHGA